VRVGGRLRGRAGRPPGRAASSPGRAARFRGRAGRQPLPAGFGSIWSTVVLDLVGFGIVLPILPLWAQDLGASGAVIGLLLASYSLAQLIGAPFLGRLSDRIGRRPLLVLALCGSAIGHLLTGLAGSVGVLVAARVLDGFSGASVSVAYAAAADLATPEERPRLFGLLGAGFAVGLVVGPALGSLAALGGYRTPFFVAAGLCGLNAATAWWRLPETNTSRRAAPLRRAPLRQTFTALTRWDQVSRLLVVSLLGGLAFAGFEATFSLVGVRRVDMTAAGAGVVFALLGVVLAVVQGGLVPRLLRGWGERRTVRLALALSVSAFALLLPPGGWALLVGGVVVLVVGQGLLSPSISSSLAALADPSARGATFGLNQSTGALSRLVGPVVAAWLFEVGGSGAPFAWGLVLSAAALLATLAVRPVAAARPISAPEPVVTHG
jgi:DHA1 family tetracycline resistance protein-like MFS transporter